MEQGANGTERLFSGLPLDEEAEAAEGNLGAVIDELKANPGGRGSPEKLDVAIRCSGSRDAHELLCDAVGKRAQAGLADPPARRKRE